MKATINNIEYDLKEAKSEEEKLKGLLNIENLDKNSGMIFLYDKPQDVSFWMKNTKIPLDIVFVNDEDEVISVKEGIPMSEEAILEKDVFYVIELNKDSNVKQGDLVDLEEQKDDTIPVMKILAPDGSTLMELEGGERIVSRRETKILIRKAKKAYNSKEDKDYKALGKYIFKVFNKLDNRDPEFVDSPK